MAGRKLLTGVTTLIFISYCSHLVQQRELTSGFLKSRVNLSPSKIDISDITGNITLDDIFISVKTTRYYQQTRLPVILKTWFLLARDQIWFFTDTDDRLNQKLTNGHMINTKCKPSHEFQNLCCKTGVEYDYFLKSKKKWFCHFDDDNYVNVPQLVTVLKRYNYEEDWYLGQISMDTPTSFEKDNSLFTFRFGTGGAGICISRSLAAKMYPYVTGGRLIAVCEYLRNGDDLALGYIIEILLHRRLTVMPEFHSHLENMGLLNPNTFKEQVSFGYNLESKNVINVPGFASDYDHTRFLSLHCFLFPHFNLCRPQQSWHARTARSQLVMKDVNRLISVNRSLSCKKLPTVL